MTLTFQQEEVDDKQEVFTYWMEAGAVEMCDSVLNDGKC